VGLESRRGILSKAGLRNCPNLGPREERYVYGRVADKMLTNPKIMTSKEETKRFPVAEEEARVRKRKVSKGRVRISTKLDDAIEIVTAELEEQKVQVTRVPVNRPVDAPPVVRTENDTTIIPIVEEVLAIEKRLVLKEELHVRRSVIRERVEIPVTVRKQRAMVERLDAATEPGPDQEKDQTENRSHDPDK
jgi:uncharacterized protein (TIGR02271 family)